MKILIVVDMQKDFIDGALGTKEAINILPAVQAKIKQYKKEGNPILFTRDTHSEEYLHTQEGKLLPVPHCIKNTSGWQIDPSLDTANATLLDKPSFGSLALAEWVKQHYPQVQEIELIGLCTDICVLSNAIILKAAFPEVTISVDSSACAGVTPASHRNALEAMKMCQIQVK
ncbi:MAG: cysteine hydrolase family protein [Candidatus Avelusimicrobium sp.]|uniref:cysteine hydrolase family protein n=1 Tax=Candidatus Avelusimicrobium sp. TaxID=3048833 RepID=UPI003F01F6DA